MRIELHKMILSRNAAAGVLFTLCAACSQQLPPDDGLDDIGRKALSAEGPAVSEAPLPMETPPSNHETKFAFFSVEPGHVDACPGNERIVSKVTWSIKDRKITDVKVMLDTEIEPNRKLFAVGGADGSAETGNWVGAGVRFYLIDAKTEKEIARHEVTMLPCLK